jgi:hypothetical protein
VQKPDTPAPKKIEAPVSPESKTGDVPGTQTVEPAPAANPEPAAVEQKPQQPDVRPPSGQTKDTDAGRQDKPRTDVRPVPPPKSNAADADELIQVFENLSNKLKKSQGNQTESK